MGPDRNRQGSRGMWRERPEPIGIERNGGLFGAHRYLSRRHFGTWAGLRTCSDSNSQPEDSGAPGKLQFAPDWTPPEHRYHLMWLIHHGMRVSGGAQGPCAFMAGRKPARELLPAGVSRRPRTHGVTTTSRKPSDLQLEDPGRGAAREPRKGATSVRRSRAAPRALAVAEAFRPGAWRNVLVRGEIKQMGPPGRGRD